jgi:peptide deformylase
MRNSSIPGAHGHVRPLTLHGDPLLHTPCAEVTDFGPELARLVEDLFATMYAAQGVGLAANQIGEPLRVFVYDCPDDEDVRHLGHMVNPRLVRRAVCPYRAWKRARSVTTTRWSRASR